MNGNVRCPQQDARFAGRLLRRDPGFAATAVLVLGLGINNMLFMILTEVVGACTARHLVRRIVWYERGVCVRSPGRLTPETRGIGEVHKQAAGCVCEFPC
jgi:hypothetical protein